MATPSNPPKETPILLYRNGPKGRLSLTPKEKDKTGVSAWDTPEDAGADLKRVVVIDTTRLRELTAVPEGDPGHYVIRPKDFSRMADWIASRDDVERDFEDWHPLTRELHEAIVDSNLRLT